MKKDRIFEILSDWNYWFKDLPKTFARQEYEKQIAKKSSTGEIIVIKGVRRSGKSTLLINEIKRVIKSGVDVKNTLFVNFEDQRFRMFDEQTLLQDIKDTYLEYIKPKGDIIIMLDEVQNIKSWEQWVLKEYELTTNRLYVTGSNSHLLGVEFGSALSGRYLDIEIFPLDFKEYLLFLNIDVSTKALRINNKIKIKQAFDEYMRYGGFPKVAFVADSDLKKDVLKGYYDSILLRDIVARYKLKNYQVLNELSLFLLSNNATINAYNRLKNNFKTSFDTIRDYVEYLSNSYMILLVNKFDYSFKKQIANPKKIYAIDVGFSNNVSFNLTQKIGQNLENIVFLKLRKERRDIYYYKTSTGLEVDFLLKEKKEFSLIQVSTTLEDERTFKRELRVFLQAKKELQSEIKAMVITLDESKVVEYEGTEVEVINIVEWLLLDSIGENNNA
jgi:predicted AAA+ superfamily ATPase